MTDDIRERVARAISDAVFLENGITNYAYDLHNDERKEKYRKCADDALLACGYEEMRKALENLLENVVFYDRVGIVDEKDFKADRANAVAKARSVLERSKGDKP